MYNQVQSLVINVAKELLTSSGRYHCPQRESNLNVLSKIKMVRRVGGCLLSSDS